MLSMKSVAAALVLVASAADAAAPFLIVPALVLGASTAVRAAPAGEPIQSVSLPAQAAVSASPEVQRQASQPSLG